MDFEKEFGELKAQITPFNTMKFVTGAIISLGAAAGVFAMMKNPINAAKGITKLIMKLGVFVLACKAGDVAEQYFRETADTVANTLKQTKEETEDGRASK